MQNGAASSNCCNKRNNSNNINDDSNTVRFVRFGLVWYGSLIFNDMHLSDIDAVSTQQFQM